MPTPMRTLLIISLCLLSSAASAAPITWQLTGTVNSEIPDIGGAALEAHGITVGSPITITMMLPESAVDTCPLDGEAFYSGGTVLGTVAGNPFSGTIAGIEANSSSVGCGFLGPGSNTSTFYVMRIHLASQFAGGLTVLFFSPTDPDIYPFPIPANASFGLHYFSFTGRPDMMGELTTVPEPSTYSLVIAGVVASAVRLRRRRVP